MSSSILKKVVVLNYVTKQLKELLLWMMLIVTASTVYLFYFRSQAHWVDEVAMGIGGAAGAGVIAIFVIIVIIIKKM